MGGKIGNIYIIVDFVFNICNEYLYYFSFFGFHDKHLDFFYRVSD